MSQMLLWCLDQAGILDIMCKLQTHSAFSHGCTACMWTPGCHDAAKCSYCTGNGIAHATMASSRQQDGAEAAVQRASTLFLQQVEDSRRRYAFEVEELKVRPKTARDVFNPSLQPSLQAQDRVCHQLS